MANKVAKKATAKPVARKSRGRKPLDKVEKLALSERGEKSQTWRNTSDNVKEYGEKYLVWRNVAHTVSAAISLIGSAGGHKEAFVLLDSVGDEMIWDGAGLGRR